MTLNSQVQVSILIPTYNRPEYIKEAIASCLNQQGLESFEIIITDNSENDLTAKAVKEFNSDKIRYISHGKNIGCIENVGCLLSYANGKYIKYLMDDDIIPPHSIKTMIDVFEANPSVGVVMAPLDIIDEKSEPTSVRFYMIHRKKKLYENKRPTGLIKGSEILKTFLTKEYPCCIPSGVMYKKECFDRLGTFDVKAKFASDVDICMNFARYYDFYYINETLASWRYFSTAGTAVFHAKGFDNSVFYYLTTKYVYDPVVRKMFASEITKLEKDSYLFSTKRCLLSFIAGLGGLDFKLVFETLIYMFKTEKYKFNLIKLPFKILFEDIIAAAISWVR